MSFKIASHPFLFAAVAGLTATGAGAYVWHEQSREPVLEVHLFSLKGGSAAFIRTPEDKRILIDGGASGDVIREITSILPFYSRRIDAVIATKDDLNHVGGLVDVVARYSINSAYIPGVTLNSLGLASSTDPAYTAFLKALDEKKIQPQPLKAADSIALDRNTKMEVLFPVRAGDFSYTKASGPEVLMRISYGSTSILFFGEATAKVQKFVASTSAASFTRTDSNALFILQSASPGNIAEQLIEKFKPDFLIYSQAVTKGNTKGSKPTKSRVDPTSGISSENRINLKQEGKAVLISNGNTWKTKSAR
jgi:competence protein ComEC